LVDMVYRSMKGISDEMCDYIHLVDYVGAEIHNLNGSATRDQKNMVRSRIQQMIGGFYDRLDKDKKRTYEPFRRVLEDQVNQATGQVEIQFDEDDDSCSNLTYKNQTDHD